MPFTDVIGHARAKTLLRAAMQNNRVAHAYLFHGPDRIGKRLLALRFFQAIACETPAGADGPDACGHCRSCKQLEQASHPDLCLVAPDTSVATPQIKIDDIRELESRLIYRPLLAERKMCLIDDADRMTIGAANALLKTLEEPPGYSLLILLSCRPFALPATIRSRCQSLRLTALSRPDTHAAVIQRRCLPDGDAHLLAAVAEGRLGEALTTDVAEVQARHEAVAAVTTPKALRMVSTLLATAETLAKGDESPTELMDRFAAWIRDLALTQLGMNSDLLTHRSHGPQLNEAARAADLETLLDLLDEIESFQRQSTRHLNPQLMLEHILLRLRDATASGPPGR